VLIEAYAMPQVTADPYALITSDKNSRRGPSTRNRLQGSRIGPVRKTRARFVNNEPRPLWPTATATLAPTPNRLACFMSTNVNPGEPRQLQDSRPHATRSPDVKTQQDDRRFISFQFPTSTPLASSGIQGSTFSCHFTPYSKRKKGKP